MSLIWSLFSRNLSSACLVMLVLSVAPALGQQTLNEANELKNRVKKLYQAGQYEEAILIAQQLLELREKALGPEHLYVGISIANLAELYHKTGQYTKAEPLYQRTLIIHEKALGPEHPATADVLNNLALLYLDLGQYAKAEPVMQRSLIIHEKALGPEHPNVAGDLNSLGGLYQEMGLYAKAEPLYQRGLAIYEKAMGSEHPDVADSLNNLAGLYYVADQYAKAEPLYQRSLVINEKVYGPNHPQITVSLNNMAQLYARMGRHERAEPLFQRSLAIREKTLGSEHPDVASSLNNLAGLYVSMGQYAKSEQLYQRSLAIWERALGPEHPKVAVSINNLSVLVAAQHDYARANRLLQRGLRIQNRQIQEIFTFTTEDQKLQFMEKIEWAYLSYLSLIHQHLSGDPDAVRDALEMVLRRKGVVFDAQSRMREMLQGRLSGEARQNWDRLAALRRELSQLTLNKPKTMTAEQYREKMATLEQQIEQSEQLLTKESALVAKELQQRNITAAAIANMLPKNGGLVEFVKIRDYDFEKVGRKPSSRYLAFVLSASGDVTLVDLGDAAMLERQVHRALRDIKVSMGARGLQLLKNPDPANPSRPSMQSLKTLYAQVWVPLEKALGTTDKVIISPDSLLNLVPFAALIDGKGYALVESHRLAYVSSGRELIGGRSDSSKPGSDLFLVANPAFDNQVTVSGSQGIALRSRDFRGAFSPLPGTERESKEIPPLVAGQKQVLVGERATESAVKTARSPRILHLATHGFFLQDEEFDPCAGTRGVTVIKKEALEVTPFCEKSRGVMVVKTENTPPPKRYENPLVRSGLAFAGANYASQTTNGDDGILTALEITGMDLYGTELVVLSACDTGVGEVKTGEGVFGLRRAFALAGAKNLLMSLWPVSDEITAKQMKAFYTNLQKMPPAEALRQAQLETIKELKSIAIYGGTAPPGLWAPFILQGGQALGQ